ncbi:hypothetical protein [Streptomyces sp. NPDC058092]|uniref:hypothetical protein n=1 Tax=Streptomyces sp. NPDC058092 TaxID=3346336 RepID=UPI0036E4E30D
MPGRSSADPELFSAAHGVPAGRRLALVIDTLDPLYIEHSPAGSQLTFSPPPAGPSYRTADSREK